MNPLITEIKGARSVMAGSGKGLNRKVKLCLWSCLYYYMFFECILALVSNWNEPDKIALAIQDINMYVSTIFVLMELSFFRENVLSVIRILEENFINEFEAENYFISDERYNLVKKYNTTVETLNKVLRIIVYVIIVGITIPAAFTTLYKVVALGVVESTDFDLPGEFSYITINFIMKPNVYTYICLYILQAICFANAKYSSTIIYLSLAGPAEKLKLEMKLLQASVHAFEQYFICQKRDSRDSNVIKRENARIMGHIKFLVRYHNFIIRETKNMNIAVRFSSLEMVQGICLQFSMYLYSVAQVNTDNLQKLNQICVMTLVVAYFYGYSTIGEEFIKEGEKLYAKLYETTWYDKPDWIKRTFLLMMSQAAHPLQIKPMGLFVIGVKSFTNVLNTAYSAFNVLRSTQT